jgi:hypothetical protein
MQLLLVRFYRKLEWDYKFSKTPSTTHREDERFSCFRVVTRGETNMAEDDSLVEKAQYSFVDVDRCFKGIIAMMTEAVSSAETSIYSNSTTRRYIPKGCHLHT